MEQFKEMMDMWQKAFTEQKFTNPVDLFNNLTKNTTEIMENNSKIMVNNLKFHKAFISYHQSIHEMMEAITDNINLMSKK